MSTKYYISNIAYDDTDHILDIEWTIDEIWQFFDVPEVVYQNLCNAEDKEEYYRSNIMEEFKGRQKWRNSKELLEIAADILLIEDLSNGVKSKNSCNESAIHIYSSWGDVKAIELLASLGSEIDAPGDCDCTPLYNAVMFHKEGAASLLLKLGASPHSTNDIGYTPFQLAVHNKDQDMIEAFSSYV